MTDTAKKIIKFIIQPIRTWHWQTFHAPKRYHHLYDTIRDIKAGSILEVGVWNGNRAVKMIAEAQQVSDQVKYYGFDLFEHLDQAEYEKEVSKKPPTEKEVEALLLPTGAEIHLYPGFTRDTMPVAVKEIEKVDFVFIDGGHSLETIENDWLYTQQVMRPGTVVIFDDYWRNRSDAGAKRIVDAIDTNKYVVEILPEVDSFNNPDFGRLDISFAKVSLKLGSA